MLSELKEIFPSFIKGNKQTPRLDEKCSKIQDFLMSGKITNQGDRIDRKFLLEKNGRKYQIEAIGIVEDFKVLVDGFMAFEFTHDNYYRCNEELVNLILD